MPFIYLILLIYVKGRGHDGKVKVSLLLVSSILVPNPIHAPLNNILYYRKGGNRSLRCQELVNKTTHLDITGYHMLHV
jgi:hypothetical protein